jgi:alanine-synthesizing transaminase
MRRSYFFLLFRTGLDGFRVTLLEEDEKILRRTFTAIRDGIVEYLQS